MVSNIANIINPIQHYSFIRIQLSISKYCYVIPIIQFRHTVKWFQIIPSNSNTSIQCEKSICTHLIVFLSISNNLTWLQSFVCTHEKGQTVLIGTYQVQSGPGSNGNDEQLKFPLNSRIRTLPSNAG